MTAEVAFVVEDGQQRRGLATVMLEHLAAVARSNGIERFFAETLPENRAMMDVFRHAGFAVTSKFDSGVISVSFPLAPSDELDQHIDDRDRAAVVASIRRILNPSSIAVVGASRTPGTIGYELVHNLVRGGFTGAVLPVNPNAGSVAGIHAYATVSEAPGPPDLAIIAVPAEAVAEVVERMRGGARWRHRHHQRRVCRARHDRARSRSIARRIGAAARHADRRAELHGARQHQSVDPNERDVRAG